MSRCAALLPLLLALSACGSESVDAPPGGGAPGTGSASGSGGVSGGAAGSGGGTVSAVCGNSQVEGGESCDDGNQSDGDGCSAACQIEAGPSDRAFPGAEGWGTTTTGGRGGRVFVVTTLAWSGPGSFSEALYATEPRTIVFEVSGVIDVPDQVPTLGPEHSHLTVAGQTSPGGITFRGTQVGGSTIYSYQPQAADAQQFRDAIFRFVRFRGQGNTDNVTVAGVHNLVFDHCDFSGTDDEALDITYAHDVTISWSTITNSGPGSQYGFLLAYSPTTRISYHHNMSANHLDRCGAALHWGDGGVPPGGAVIDIRNNVMHNCAYETFFHVWANGEKVSLNFVGNTMKSGPDSGTIAMLGLEDGVDVFHKDNVFDGMPLVPSWSQTKLDNQLVTEATAEHAAASVTTQSAGAAYQSVMTLSGALPRDSMSVRTFAQVKDGTGSLASWNDALIESGPAAPADVDRDGMPDAWETTQGLAVGTDDAGGDLDNDGWTNLEEWLHERAQQLLSGK